MTIKNEQAPYFNFVLPPGYLWLIENRLIGFGPFSGLQPWYYLDKENTFSVSQRWPKINQSEASLIAFAKRQDNDDLACFKVHKGQVTAVVRIHGWAPDGYDIIAEYQSFWDWLKSVIDDIAEWVDLPIA